MSRGEGSGYDVDGPVLSDRLTYINLAETVLGLDVFLGPIRLCECVNEEPGDGEGVKGI
jgi:hypothetical protein